MVFPFGVSISDFIEGIKVLKKSIKSLSETQGARADYGDLLCALRSLKHALKSIESVPLDLPTQQAHREAVKKTVERCRICVEDFLLGITKFEILGAISNTQNKFSKLALKECLRKIQWSLCKKEEIAKFKSEVQMHVDAVQMLLLTFQIEQTYLKDKIMRDFVADAFIQVENRLKVGQKDHIKLCTETKDLISVEQGSLKAIHEEVSSGAAVVRDQGYILLELQKKLSDGLSAEDQCLMFQMLYQTMEQNRDLQQKNKELIQHALDIKTMLRVQYNPPPQVLLQEPVILHDARGRPAPFHLDFITSADAFLAVLKIRFKDIGARKIALRQFDLREASRQKEIVLSRPWETVFLPGQTIEMGMIFLGNSLPPDKCPGCQSRNEKVPDHVNYTQCGSCPLKYRRTNGAVEMKTKDEDQTIVEIEEDEEDEDIAEFSRVSIHTVKLSAPADISYSRVLDSEAFRLQTPDDLLDEPQTSPLDVLSRQGTGGEHEGRPIRTPSVYYCCSCSDGPTSLLNCPICCNCGHYACSNCFIEN